MNCTIFRQLFVGSDFATWGKERRAAVIKHYQKCPHCEEWVGKLHPKENLQNLSEKDRADIDQILRDDGLMR